MWIVAAIIAIMAYEVVMRYAFVRPTIWASELSLWLAGMVYLLRRALRDAAAEPHPNLPALRHGATFWLRKTFDVVSTLCLVLFCARRRLGRATARRWRSSCVGRPSAPPSIRRSPRR